MNIIKRGQISIRKNLGKNLVFLIIILLLGIVASGAIIVNQAINRTNENLRLSIPTVVTVGVDEEAVFELYSEWEHRWGQTLHLFEPITANMIQEIGELPYVHYVNYSIKAFAFSHFERYTPITEALDGNMDGWGGVFLTVRGETIRSNILLNGVSSPNMIQFENEIFRLDQGRLFTESELTQASPNQPTPVLISTEFAQLNNLSLNSVFNLYRSLFTPPEDADIPGDGFINLTLDEMQNHPYNTWLLTPYQFEIVGIFDIDIPPAQHSETFSMQSSLYNTFLIPNWKAEIMTIDEINDLIMWQGIFNPGDGMEHYLGLSPGLLQLDNLNTILENISGHPNFLLEDSNYIEQFRIAANEILPEFWTIDAFTQIFDPLQNATSQLALIANQALLFTLGATLLVLSLLITLYLRDRKHELGIYLALGERKRKIIFQILFEVISVALIGLTFAIFIGNVISTQLSNELVISELTQRWESGPPPRIVADPTTGIGMELSVLPSELEFSGLVRELTPEELMDFFDVSLDIQTIVIFYAVGFTTLILSAVVPIIYVLELNPKEILMQGKIG